MLWPADVKGKAIRNPAKAIENHFISNLHNFSIPLFVLISEQSGESIETNSFDLNVVSVELEFRYATRSASTKSIRRISRVKAPSLRKLQYAAELLGP